MKTTREIVAAVRDLYGSDSKAAPAVGVSQNSFTEWRNGTAFPSDDYAIKLAELVRLDERYVVAIVRRDRAKSDRVRKVWNKIAEGFAAVAFTVGVATLGGFNNNVFAAPSAPQLDEANTHCARRKRRRSSFAAAVALILGGCAVMDHAPAPADWPELRVVERYVPDAELRARCSAYTVFPEACAEVYFDRGECVVWLNRDYHTLDLVRSHELEHCAGHDHIGEHQLADAWSAYKASHP